MQQLIRGALIAIEVALLSSLVLATRCANYQDVFVGKNIYFTDADCYARMTRVRMCAKNPGLIVRHHDFENYPDGTTPHTTAPLDYLILGFSIVISAANLSRVGEGAFDYVDLAGALISPLLALLGAWFLWWWSRELKFRYRWAMLILYAISPILVHGSELGRPDHQSLSMLLVIVGICAEWTPAREPTKQWSAVSGIAWALAIWVSAYEPLVLFLLLLAVKFGQVRSLHFAPARRIGWILFGAIIAIALLIERRIPSFAIFGSGATFKNWADTIGELAHVSPANPAWLHWTGYLLLIVPFLFWLVFRKRSIVASGGHAFLISVLLVATYCLTIWQTRWAYFFALIFAIMLPMLLAPIKSSVAVWIAFVLSIFPILRDWDERLWPNEFELARRIEQRSESWQIRELAVGLKSQQIQPVLAPWWLSPAITYWSAQPSVAGSSHESLNGIADTARFFLADDWQQGAKILKDHAVVWVMAYDSQRLGQNSAAIMGAKPSGRELCFVLDRTPSRAPPFLVFAAQNSGVKLYRVVNKL